MTEAETLHAAEAGRGFGGSLAGATFRFRTAAADVAAYAQKHLAPLASESPQAPNVDITLRWHDGQPPKDRVAAFPDLVRMERVDRDLYVRPGELQWFRVDDLRDLYLRFRWHEQQLTVEGDFFYRVANDARRDWAKRLLYRKRVAALRRRRFTTMLYYLVYYPCWWWLEQSRGLHPIHAAGVETTKGIILLAGASGVGKSTLAVALAMLPGARLLSDSFVVHDEAEVFPVREPVLLDAWSRRWLGTHGDELLPIDWRYCLNRTGYHVPPTRLGEGGRAVLLLFPHRSPEAYARRVSCAEAHQRLSAADLIINDLRRYWAFAAILEQIAPAGLVAKRERQLARLTAAVPCYDVGLTPNMTSAGVTQAVMRLIPTRLCEPWAGGRDCRR